MLIWRITRPSARSQRHARCEAIACSPFAQSFCGASSLKHKSIPVFLSAEQIAPHHTAHYGGALKGYAAADAKIEEWIKAGQPLDPAAFGALKRGLNSKGNSVVLHEMYFDGLAPKALDPAADIRTEIEKRFGSVEKWASDFISSAKDAAGWAILVKHPVNGKFYNVVSDEHASTSRSSSVISTGTRPTSGSRHTDNQIRNELASMCATTQGVR